MRRANSGLTSLEVYGRISIATFTIQVDEESGAPAHQLSAGPYVCIEVSDDGCGIDEDTQARAFEPFFTTKPLGSGTGLGLSMVHGIVRQSEGDVAITSKPGVGTNVSVYLPLVHGAREGEAAPDVG